jgi:hypothetical protein
MGAHYAPFAGLQWALVFICLQNYWSDTLHNITSALMLTLCLWLFLCDRYHKVDSRIPLPNWLGLSYLILLVGLTFLKQAFTLGAINDHPIWCSTGPNCSSGARAAQGLDIIWMVLAAVTPAILAYYARRTTPNIRITINMGDERFVGMQHTVPQTQMVSMKSVPMISLPPTISSSPNLTVTVTSPQNGEIIPSVPFSTTPMSSSSAPSASPTSGTGGHVYAHDGDDHHKNEISMVCL